MAHAPDEAPTRTDVRRPPFFYQTHDALNAIRNQFTGARRTTAIAVYLVLTEAANELGGEEARGGFQAARKILAERVGVSVWTLDKYIPGLVEAGVLEVVRTKVGNVNLPNTWRLTDPLSTGGGGVADHARGGSTRAAVKPSKEPFEEKGTSSLTERGTDAPPKPVLVSGQNLPFNALRDGCNIDTRGNRAGRVAVALNGKGSAVGIRDLFWREMTDWARDNDRLDVIEQAAENPVTFERALEKAIGRKIDMYVRRMPGAELTPTALRDWWFDLETERRHGDGLTADEMRNFEE